MKKQQLLEQQEKIMKMFSYKPGMTISENDEHYQENVEQINEIAPLAAVGWGLTAVWAGYEIWKWADNAWGEKSTTKRIKWATQPGTWDSLNKRIKKTSIALGEDISGQLKIISRREAGKLAETLYDAMYGGGTKEDQIRKVMDKCSSFMDLARISDRFGERAGWPGTGSRYDLWYWIDDELSQSDYEWSVYDPMKSKPLLIWNDTQFNDFEKWAVELTELIAEKEAQPKKDDQNKKTIINALKGKKGACMEEYLKDAVIGATPKGVPFLKYTDGDVELNVFANGRFFDVKTSKMGTIQNCEEVVTESVDSILNLNWVLGSLTEQFKVIYDDDKENIVTIKDKEVTQDETGGEEVEKTVEPVKPKWTLYTGDPTNKDEFVKEWHFNKDAGSIIKQIQKILGIKEDGYYGKNTKKAVMDYQKKNGLKVDGAVGVETWTKMNEKTEVAGEELTVKDKTDVEKEVVKVVQDVQQNKVNVPTRREEIQTEVLGAQGNKKMQKNYCKNLIAFEAGMLKSNMEKATDLKALSTCYNEYNFNAIGDNSRKVRKAYNLKKSGNPV